MGWLSDLFGGSDPSAAAQPYLSQIPQMLPQYFKPYMQAGQQAMQGYMGQLGGLISDPGEMLNKIGEQYQQSPGLQFAIQQAMRGAGHSAATGGMAGSPEAMQQSQQLATKLGEQDYYNWLNQAKGMYGQGLQGLAGMTGMGERASTGLGEDLAQALMNQAKLAYSGAANQNEMTGGILGSLGSLASLL